MRLLLTNVNLEYLGGTQVWTHGMWKELSKTHQVDVYTHQSNDLWPELPRFVPEAHYDAALINHWPCFRDLRAASIKTRVFTSHGWVNGLETPVLGADAYVSVSELSRARVPYRSSVIAVPIDLEKFRPTRPLNPRLRRVAFVSNRQGRARPLIEAACEHLGVELRIIGKDHKTRDVAEVYNWADLVFAVATTALEAMACGRNVICFDTFGAAGLVTEEDLPQLRASMFGGHLDPAASPWYTVEELVRVMRRYDNSRSMRDYVHREHSPARICSQYLRLIDDLKSEPRYLHSAFNSAVRRGPAPLTSPKITRAIRRIRSLNGDQLRRPRT